MEFRDLKRQYEALKDKIDIAVADVMSSGNYISGFQITELERMLSSYIGVKHCITCGNGTDAMTLALMAWGIGSGDAVFVPDFTFFASGECAAYLGAAPVFVDVDEHTYNLDSQKLEREIVRIKENGELTPKVVIAVDLFGLPADYDAIKKVCNKYNLYLLEDGAQGFGGMLNKKRACSFGDISTTSFFPAKPLGCYGDGGAIFTDNDEWADLIRSYAVHGKGDMKYDNVRIGMNSRLDTIQAAVLQIKFKAFLEYELKAVNQVATWYYQMLEDVDIYLPEVPEGYESSWAQFTIQLPNGVDRNILQKKLQSDNIPSMVYYPKPMHCQQAFKDVKRMSFDCPITERLCKCVLSLPMSPYLTKEEIRHIGRKIIELL